MCYPLLIMAAISVATTLASAKQQKDSANKQEQVIQDGLAKDRAATAAQYDQIQKTSMDDQAKLHTDYMIDAARIQAMQGESGMQGASHDRVAAEAANNSSSDMATLESNRRNQTGQAHIQAISQQSRAGVQLAGIKQPSSVGTALQIAGGVAGIYAKDAPTGTPSGTPS